MSIRKIISVVNEISEVEQLRQHSTNSVDIEIYEMEVSILKQELLSCINQYIETGAFSNSDRYRIQLEKDNIYLIEPSTFEILFAFEEFLKRKEEYQTEKDYLSRDLSKRLLDAFNMAKENLIITISAFIRGFKHDV